MEFKNVSINGTTIPNECECIWCGGKMKRNGATFMGAGVNQFALFCDCGAILIHAKDPSRKIDSVKVSYDFKDN